MAGQSPYADLPDRAFWKSGVSNRTPLTTTDLYQPRFAITRQTPIATAGSCFAQHVGRTLMQDGFNVIAAETAPSEVSDAIAQAHGLRMFSARYGNIYTTRQLVQLFDEAFGTFTPADAAWEKDGRIFDAMRPAVEPAGFADVAEMQRHRAAHLKAVRRVFETAEVVVFTLGLTEAWRHKPSGTVYPTAPGTIAGTFDPEIHEFVNFTHGEIIDDMRSFMAKMAAIRADIRFLLTTSPVPLTATASGQHVEVATCYSKAVLRAVCGQLYQENENVDYFPSYEIITSARNHGVFFEPNLRSVSPIGVRTAMSAFLQAHTGAAGPAAPATRDATDVQCEEALLEGFAK